MRWRRMPQLLRALYSVDAAFNTVSVDQLKVSPAGLYGLAAECGSTRCRDR